MKPDDDVLKVILALGNPTMGGGPGKGDMEPGMHGPMEGHGAVPKDATELLMCIKDMICEFLGEGMPEKPMDKPMKEEKPESDMPDFDKEEKEDGF